eukprot:2353848-Pyramimonas_sp.AAC.1
MVFSHEYSINLRNLSCQKILSKLRPLSYIRKLKMHMLSNSRRDQTLDLSFVGRQPPMGRRGTAKHAAAQKPGRPQNQQPRPQQQRLHHLLVCPSGWPRRCRTC